MLVFPVFRKVDLGRDALFEGWSCNIWRAAWMEVAVSEFILNSTRFASHCFCPPVLVSSLEQLYEVNNTM